MVWRPKIGTLRLISMYVNNNWPHFGFYFIGLCSNEDISKPSLRFFLGLHTATPKMTLIQIAEKVLLLKSWFGSWSLIFRLKHTISWEGLFLHLNIGEQNVSFGWPTSTRATITHTKHTQSSALKQALFFNFYLVNWFFFQITILLI